MKLYTMRIRFPQPVYLQQRNIRHTDYLDRCVRNGRRRDGQWFLFFFCIDWFVAQIETPFFEFWNKKHPTFQLGASCSCVCFCAFTFARLSCFSLADNEYGNRYSNSESNKANDNPNPSVRRIARRNRESGSCVTACRADGKCVLALRKRLKI